MLLLRLIFDAARSDRNPNLSCLSCISAVRVEQVVWNKSLELGVTLRKAAYAVACERILEAHRERGWYPEVQLS
jgi:hypothetical protein